MAKDKAVVEWQAPEYVHQEKSVDWFWAIGVFALAIAVIAIFLGNVLFGVFVILAAISVAIHTVRKPRLIDYALTERGVLIDKKVYPYDTLEAFWIDEDDSRLIIRSEKALMPYLVLPFREDDEDDIQNVLIEYLDEEEMHEPLSHKILEYVGF